MTARSASGFHALEQQRGSDLALRSNAVSGVTREEPWPGLATDNKRGPFGFSRWGRGKRVREKRASAAKRAGLPRSRQGRSDREVDAPSGATATAFKSLLFPPTQSPVVAGKRAAPRAKPEACRRAADKAVCLQVVPTVGIPVGITVGTRVGTTVGISTRSEFRRRESVRCAPRQRREDGRSDAG
jgi:hypothetical protein